MPEPGAPTVDPKKVRAGLVLVVLVVLVAGVLAVVVDDPIGRAVMVAVAALGIMRAFLLSRSLRR